MNNNDNPSLRFFIPTKKENLSSKKTVRFGDTSEVGSRKLLSVVSIILILVMWVVIGELNIVPELFWPHPRSVIEKFILISTEGYKGLTLLEHLWESMFRVLSGFFLGCITGIPIGIAMGLNSYVRGFMDPIIELYRPVPPLAFIPIVIIWMGIGNVGKIFLLFLACFSIMVINSRSGVKSVELEKVQAAYSLGANRWQVLFHVILINALPEIFTGMRVSMGVAWGTLVAAEMVASVNGVGWMVLNAARFLMTDIVIMGIILMGVVGYGFDLIMRNIEKRMIPWKGKE